MQIKAGRESLIYNPRMSSTALHSGRTVTVDGTAGSEPHRSVAAVRFGGDARTWTTLAVGSLLLAGLLSLSVVIGRLPPFSSWIADPLFFKRCLVVHVDLALLVWFYAFVCALLALSVGSRTTAAGRCLGLTAAAGVLMMLAGAVIPGASPVLSNYVPVIDHPMFLGGLALFSLSVTGYLLLHLLQRGSGEPRLLPGESCAGLQAAAVAVILAATTWIAAQAGMPQGLARFTYFELSMWGPGHALQVANVCAMVAVWFWLLHRATGNSVISTRLAAWLFILLLVPHFVLPLLSATGTNNALYVNGATRLMRWAIFPVVLIVLVLAFRHIWLVRPISRKSDARQAALAGFFASAGLTILGFVLGAMIRESTTLIPAHYHASLGGVTASFMAAAYLIVERAGPMSGFPRWRAARRQLLLYGFGQAVFALGFAIGGLYGLGRKAYAEEQVVRSTGEVVGLSIMGLGGLLAAAAGVWFLVLILGAIIRWWHHPFHPEQKANVYE